MILNYALAMLGALLFAIGLYLVWPPLVMLVGGASLFTIGLIREVPDGPTD